MFYVYVLRDSESSRQYIGLTSDLKRRLKEHRAGRTRTTSAYREKELIFYEAFLAEQDAIRREQYFKTTKGKRALKPMLKESIK